MTAVGDQYRVAKTNARGASPFRPFTGKWASALVLLFAALPAAMAGVVTGGPCVPDTAANYLTFVGFTGCVESDGGRNAILRLDGVGFGTNVGGTLPTTDQLLITPSFTAVPNGFEQILLLSIVPGTWTGVPGQTFSTFLSVELETADPFTTIVNTVTSQVGDITADVCEGPGYTFGSLCIGGNDHSSTSTNATSATATAGPLAPFTTFGLMSKFDGILPAGTFGGVNLDAVVTTPEPGTRLVWLGAAVMIAAAAIRARSRSRLHR